jgi:hypothetical protein
VSDDEDSRHLSASAISAELYLGHADNDQSMTPEHVAALEQALEEDDRRLTPPRTGADPASQAAPAEASGSSR